MNIIKKLFPKYETKAELRDQISFLESISNLDLIETPKFRRVDMDIRKIGATLTFEGKMAQEEIDNLLARELIKEIEPLMKIKITEIVVQGPERRQEIKASIYVAVEKKAED